jgi:hypothetical protein
MPPLGEWVREITQPRVLLAEGADAHWFCLWAKEAYNLVGVQVIDYGGVKNLPRRLKALRLVTGYDRVEALAVLRDAEADASAALASVQHALETAGLPVPQNVGKIVAGPPRTAVFLFPGLFDDAGKPVSGTLEELCLATVADKPVMKCVDSFIDCATSAGCDARRRHKARVHAYLSANDKFVGLKLGEAAKAGAWD